MARLSIGPNGRLRFFTEPSITQPGENGRLAYCFCSSSMPSAILRIPQASSGRATERRPSAERREYPSDCAAPSRHARSSSQSQPGGGMVCRRDSADTPSRVRNSSSTRPPSASRAAKSLCRWKGGCAFHRCNRRAAICSSLATLNLRSRSVLTRSAGVTPLYHAESWQKSSIGTFQIKSKP